MSGITASHLEGEDYETAEERKVTKQIGVANLCVQEKSILKQKTLASMRLREVRGAEKKVTKSENEVMRW